MWPEGVSILWGWTSAKIHPGSKMALGSWSKPHRKFCSRTFASYINHVPGTSQRWVYISFKYGNTGEKTG